MDATGPISFIGAFAATLASSQPIAIDTTGPITTGSETTFLSEPTQSEPSQPQSSPQDNSHGAIGAGGICGIVIGSTVAVCILVMVISYIFIGRRNAKKRLARRHQAVAKEDSVNAEHNTMIAPEGGSDDFVMSPADSQIVKEIYVQDRNFSYGYYSDTSSDPQLASRPFPGDPRPAPDLPDVIPHSPNRIFHEVPYANLSTPGHIEVLPEQMKRNLYELTMRDRPNNRMD